MRGDADRRPARYLQRSHVAVLAGLAPSVVAWWWVAELTNRVATRDLTDFDPETAGLALVGLVVAGSLAAFVGLYLVFRGHSAAVYWVASAVVWSAALALGLVTVTIVP